MTRQERDELRELATAATSGPWEAAECGGHLVMAGPLAENSPGYIRGGRGQIAEMNDDDEDGFQQEANAAFIAAANPSVILALLDALDSAERTPAESSSS